MNRGTAGDIAFHFAEQLIVVSNEGDLDFNGFPAAGIRQVLLDSLTVGFVGELFADLRQRVLTLGILPVGSECRAFAHHVTAAAQQVARRAQLGGRDRGLG